MESFLAFVHRRATAVIIFAIAAGVVGVLLLARVSFDANILRLLPQHSPAVQSFEVFLRDFGSLDHLYIMFESPDDISEHTDLVSAYAEALRGAPEIDTVDTELFEPGKDWTYLADRTLYLLGADAAADALTRFRPPGLHGEIVHARDLLSAPSAQVKALVQQDPLGLFSILRDRIGQDKGFIALDPTQPGYVSRDGRARLVIVKPKGAPFDNEFCKALFARLSLVESTARREAGPADPAQATVTIQPAGAYRVSLETEALIRREGLINSVGSLILLLVIVFWLFRTPWVVVYGLAPLALAGLLTLGLNGLIKGSLSPSTSGSAGMLFGLGIDGIILLYMRNLEERRAGYSVPDATRRMAGTAWSVIVAQGTTAATFLALLLIDFPTLQDLGSLVGLGMLLCCALTLLLLPAMLSKTGAQQGRALTAQWLGDFVTRAARPIVWIGAIATIALAAASTQVRLDTGVEKLQAQTGGAVLERQVADRFSLPRDVLLVLNDGGEIDPLLETDRRLAETLTMRMPSVLVSGIGSLLPPAGAQAAVGTAIRDSGLTVGRVSDDIEDAARVNGFKPDVFAPFLQRVPRLLDPAERITYDGLVAHGLDSITSRFLVRRNGQYQAVTYLYAQQTIDIDALGSLIRGIDPRLRLTGLPAINHELRQHFLPQFVKGLGIGVVAVALLIYMVFRSVSYTLLAMLPTLMGFIWSAGILGLLRIELDLFSLFAAITFIGIAVDYGIYVLHRFAVEGPRDIHQVLTRTGAAIMIACSTALVGFGTLINSSYSPLRVFGIVSVVTLTCCLVASIIFLPALILQAQRWSRSAH